MNMAGGAAGKFGANTVMKYVPATLGANKIFAAASPAIVGVIIDLVGGKKMQDFAAGAYGAAGAQLIDTFMLPSTPPPVNGTNAINAGDTYSRLLMLKAAASSQLPEGSNLPERIDNEINRMVEGVNEYQY